MSLLLRLVDTAGKQSPVVEDAFLAIGAMTSALDAAFHPYLNSFSPYLANALGSHEEYQLCSIAVGLVGDICRALGPQSLPYCQGFMEVLLTALQSPVLHRSVKPPILSCFGDVALAVGPSFEPFLETTMNVLQQAGAMRADPVSRLSSSLLFSLLYHPCRYNPGTCRIDAFVSRRAISISSITSTDCEKGSWKRTRASSAGSRLEERLMSFSLTSAAYSDSFISPSPTKIEPKPSYVLRLVSSVISPKRSRTVN